jgi:hypothetical protein
LGSSKALEIEFGQRPGREVCMIARDWLTDAEGRFKMPLRLASQPVFQS